MSYGAWSADWRAGWVRRWYARSGHGVVKNRRARHALDGEWSETVGLGDLNARNINLAQFNRALPADRLCRSVDRMRGPSGLQLVAGAANPAIRGHQVPTSTPWAGLRQTIGAQCRPQQWTWEAAAEAPMSLFADALFSDPRPVVHHGFLSTAWQGQSARVN